jgi:hypothetical protein
MQYSRDVEKISLYIAILKLIVRNFRHFLDISEMTLTNTVGLRTEINAGT